jgi:hypothetical protein
MYQDHHTAAFQKLVRDHSLAELAPLLADEITQAMDDISAEKAALPRFPRGRGAGETSSCVPCAQTDGRVRVRGGQRGRAAERPSGCRGDCNGGGERGGHHAAAELGGGKSCTRATRGGGARAEEVARRASHARGALGERDRPGGDEEDACGRQLQRVRSRCYLVL